MKLFRAAFFLLLLGNLVLGAYWYLNPNNQPAPATPSASLYPELIAPISGEDAKNLVAQAPAASAPQEEESVPVADQAEDQSEPQSTPVSAELPQKERLKICRAYAGIDPALSANLIARAGRLDGVVVRESRQQEGATRYWVNIPASSGGKAGAEQRLSALKDKGIDDVMVVYDAGESQFSISLGLYSSEVLAQKRVSFAKEKGIENVRITRRDPVATTRVELEGPSAQVEALEKAAGKAISRENALKCKTR